MKIPTEGPFRCAETHLDNTILCMYLTTSAPGCNLYNNKKIIIVIVFYIINICAVVNSHKTKIAMLFSNEHPHMKRRVKTKHHGHINN